jgi:hypothetical protein
MSTVPYYANIGPRSGPILWCDGYRTIGVLAAPDDREPIGTALSTGASENGLALWGLAVRDEDVRRRWIVLGGEFVPTK